MSEYVILFVVVFVIGILSGFGLGFIIFWVMCNKRMKAYFCVAAEQIERFDFLLESLSDDSNECEDCNDGNLQTDSI